MISVRAAMERGHFDFGWLDTYHTFSFGEYYDPRFMNFRALRVINEDRVQAGRGFPTHRHRDMEILTYVLEGALAHTDSLGNGSTIRPGDVQRMSAGRGVAHSEYNHAKDEAVHFLQIWIIPEREGLSPSYEQKNHADRDKRGRLLLIASPDDGDDSVKVHQDVRLYATALDAGQAVTHELAAQRYAWVQVARGRVLVNGQTLQQGDGAAIKTEPSLKIVGESEAEVLLFDLN
jgi:redox-sensitive bicupin YhaK (pirin superfamily)